MSVIENTKRDFRVIAVSAICGGIEFYDFIVFVFLADIFSQLFFPATNQYMSLLKIFGVFAVGYFFRPLGGAFFGYLGDKVGRKKIVVITLLLMALPTFFIAFLPTYADIGAWAGIILIFLRILQGLSVGGIIPGALTYTGEYVNPQIRGLACGIIYFGLNFGMIIGSLIILILNFLPAKSLLLWGWRVPFLIGGLIALLGYRLQKKLEETPVFSASHKLRLKAGDTIFTRLLQHKRQLISGSLLACFQASVISLLYLFMPTYLTVLLHFPKNIVSIFNFINILVFSLMILLVGHLSDRFGRRILLILGTGGFILFGYLLFFILKQSDLTSLVISMVCFSIFGSCATSVAIAAMIELFPTDIRFTGVSISFNIGFMFCGGLAPTIAVFLIKYLNNLAAPGYYITFTAVLGLIGALSLKNRQCKSLAEGEE